MINSIEPVQEMINKYGKKSDLNFKNFSDYDVISQNNEKSQ